MSQQRRAAGSRSPGPLLPAPAFAGHRRQTSSSSDSSTASHQTAFSTAGRSPFNAPPARPYTPSASGLQNFSRPVTHQNGFESPLRRERPPASPLQQQFGSQGHFEPFLPSTSSQHPNMAALTASRIAAQAAQTQNVHQQTAHARKRSLTLPVEDGSPQKNGRSKSAMNNAPSYQGGFPGTYNAATTAANVAFPRTDPKPEKSKMKLFSKPKSIIVSKDKISQPIASPRSMGMPRLISERRPSFATANASSTSLVEPSTSPTSINPPEKHKHHFLSRPKRKDTTDFHLPLSSASSNSKPLDPLAPQSLYNFAPSSPSPAATFKSVSGLDLRHGGRALRERNEEIAPVVLPSSESLQGFGLTGMTHDDAWPYLKTKVLILFEGEDLKQPVEDFNRLVVIHVQRCVQSRSPVTLIEDLRDLLQTGFMSLDSALRMLPDDKLIPQLVEMWLFVFGTVLPYIQAVFLPLQLEFKGIGTVMNSREAREFWGGLPETGVAFLEEELDVRRMVLLEFRDAVIIPRHDKLNALFSRLSLESINTVSMPDLKQRHSASLDPPGSYNSQGSTLLNDISGPGSFIGRSRAASNTSTAWSAPDMSSVQFDEDPILDMATITETVGRMLQCVSVLASTQSGDDAQRKMDGLAKTLKHNWLGRGRTGRNRRGFVGTKLAARQDMIKI